MKHSQPNQLESQFILKLRNVKGAGSVALSSKAVPKTVSAALEHLYGGTQVHKSVASVVDAILCGRMRVFSFSQSVLNSVIEESNSVVEKFRIKKGPTYQGVLAELDHSQAFLRFIKGNGATAKMIAVVTDPYLLSLTEEPDMTTALQLLANARIDNSALMEQFTSLIMRDYRDSDIQSFRTSVTQSFSFTGIQGVRDLVRDVAVLAAEHDFRQELRRFKLIGLRRFDLTEQPKAFYNQVLASIPVRILETGTVATVDDLDRSSSELDFSEL